MHRLLLPQPVLGRSAGAIVESVFTRFCTNAGRYNLNKW